MWLQALILHTQYPFRQDLLPSFNIIGTASARLLYVYLLFSRIELPGCCESSSPIFKNTNGQSTATRVPANDCGRAPKATELIF